MKKLVSTVALVIAVIFASAGYNDIERSISIGDDAPGLSVTNSLTSFDLDESKGNYVLLTFWTTSDAQSRANCNVYSAWFEAHNPENIKHISVNFDGEKRLFDEIVRLDNLDKEAQFNVNGSDASQIRHDFGLDNGYGSVLIGPDGLISLFNPSTGDLSSLI